MVVALGKLYSSRTQRGGLRLHRSLLLTLVMKSARDMYHAAQAQAESVAPGYERQHTAADTEITAESSGAHPQHPGPSSPATGEPRTSYRGASVGPPAQESTGAENKENLCPNSAAQQSRKRRGKAAREPDFLPCKKAKLEQEVCPPPLSVSSVLIDYVSCGAELGAPPTPMPLHRAIAAC